MERTLAGEMAFMKKADKVVPLILAGFASVLLVKGIVSDKPYREDALVVIETAILVKDCLKDKEDKEE